VKKILYGLIRGHRIVDCFISFKKIAKDQIYDREFIFKTILSSQMALIVVLFFDIQRFCFKFIILKHTLKTYYR